MAKSSKQVWAEPPEGLVRAHLGRPEKLGGGRLMVPVVAICERDGKRVREVTRLYPSAQGIKGVRLQRVRKTGTK